MAAESRFKNSLNTGRPTMAQSIEFHSLKKISFREHTSGYHWGEGKGKGQDWGRGLRDTNYYV